MNEEHKIWEDDQCTRSAWFTTEKQGKSKDKINWQENNMKKTKAKLKNNLSIIWARWNLQRRTSKLNLVEKPQSRVTRSDYENTGSISHNTLNCLKDTARS